jgi:hypothetical protein
MRSVLSMLRLALAIEVREVREVREVWEVGNVPEVATPLASWCAGR